MTSFTPAQLSQRIVQLGLLEPLQVEQAWSEVGRVDGSCDDLLRVLQRKQLLTNLQVDRILKGEMSGYFYGQYKVLYLIGAGTFARVYRAVHRETGRIAAVKVLRRRHRGEPAQVEQFMREAKVGIQLRHPNIVAIYEVDPDPRNPYMVMEFVEGQTLRELVKIRGKLEPLTAMRLIADVATGLAHASTYGITHRDMKLSNVLVTSQGRAKLVDFGLAALADTSNEQALADCPNARAIDYAALERGTGVRKDDPRSDLYFLGCMLYHCLSGVSPLTETRDRMARLNVSRFREVQPLGQLAPELPLNLLAYCQKAMEFDPTKRFQTAALMGQELRALIERVQAGDTETVPRERAPGEAAGDEEISNEGAGHSIMLVESKIEFQNLIRDKLKKRGYRVLVYSDPERALARFAAGEDRPAECVIFSAPELGGAALDAFNRLGSDSHTADMPAILLVDRKQQFVIRHAKTGPKRVMIGMPLKVRDLRTTLLRLLTSDEGASVENESVTE
ncbi:MAG: protein kinase domain-containing protein [Aureliella sp.]